MYLLSVTALSVAMAWLYWRTNGSLLLTMLLHAAVNNTKDIVPSALSSATNAFSFRSSSIGWLTVALLWICAAYFLVRMRRVKLDGDWPRAIELPEIASADTPAGRQPESPQPDTPGLQTRAG